MLLAGHIKPWKDSSPTERLDLRNGLAGCPAHDVAFDTGPMTVNGGLRIQVARSLADAASSDPMTRQYFGRAPLREPLCSPTGPSPRDASISTGTGTISLPSESQRGDVIISDEAADYAPSSYG